MPHGTVIEIIPAARSEVFQLLHDYGRRLEWDTLLQDARLCDGVSEAQLHATSLCTGRWSLGHIAMMTEYITFDRPNVAAVKMLNRPPLFESFAATIRHQDCEDGTSTIEYKYSFTARPCWCRWLLHPLMGWILHWETRKRLRGLREWFLRRENTNRVS